LMIDFFFLGMNNKSQARRGCAKSENGNVVRLVVNSGSEGRGRQVGTDVFPV
jgi:hypothetical protein